MSIFLKIRSVFYKNGEIKPWTVPLVLLLVAFAGYGLYINHLSYYWDDWSFAWARFFQGFRGLKAVADATRPMRAYIENTETQIIGINPISWQVYSVLLRWLASVTLWWFLRQLWEDQSLATFIAPLLYLVYPGFSQQSIALTYHYGWLFQSVLFVSFGLMVWAIKHRRYFWIGMLGASVLMAIQLFSSEYMLGTELLRPIFIWIALGNSKPDSKQRLRDTVFYSLPFVIILCSYLYWRIFIFEFPSYQPLLLNRILSSPATGIKELIDLVWYSFKVVTVGAWENTLQISINSFGTTRFTTIYPFLILFCTIGLILYQNNLMNKSSNQTNSSLRHGHVWQFIGIGLLGILLAGIPFYVTGLKVTTSFESDRWSLSYIFSVSLFIAGLLLLFRDHKQSIVLASILAGLAIGVQFYNSAMFRREADLQRSFAWQLTWRIPALKQNTSLLADNLIFKFADDEALSYLLNWTYAPENDSTQLSYSLQRLSTRLGKEIPSLMKNQEIYSDAYLLADFKGSTNQVLVLYFNPPSCLRILDPKYDRYTAFFPIYTTTHGLPVVTNPQVLSPLAAKALPLSNMETITTKPEHSARPPSFLFDPEPSTSWCYFFEKADLARQDGDWQKVADLADEAFNGNYFPQDLSEYLPFIEAFARLGRLEEAGKLTQMVSEPVPTFNPALCDIWQRVEKENPLPSGSKQLIEKIKVELSCDIPLDEIIP
jgi:hypothetical protein